MTQYDIILKIEFTQYISNNYVAFSLQPIDRCVHFTFQY
jgi:hypothetical protein